MGVALLFDERQLAHAGIEEFFQHQLPFEQERLMVATRTPSLTRWARTGSRLWCRAMKPKDLARVIVDTTVQPKAVAFPTDAKLLNTHQSRAWRAGR